MIILTSIPILMVVEIFVGVCFSRCFHFKLKMQLYSLLLMM
jgi:hypothetical protein